MKKLSNKEVFEQFAQLIHSTEPTQSEMYTPKRFLEIKDKQDSININYAFANFIDDLLSQRLVTRDQANYLDIEDYLHGDFDEWDSCDLCGYSVSKLVDFEGLDVCPECYDRNTD